MPTEQQAIRVMTAWEELIEALKDAGDDDLQGVRDLYVLCQVGGAGVHESLFRELHQRAEEIRQTLRGRGVRE